MKFTGIIIGSMLAGTQAVSLRNLKQECPASCSVMIEDAKKIKLTDPKKSACALLKPYDQCSSSVVDICGTQAQNNICEIAFPGVMKSPIRALCNTYCYDKGFCAKHLSQMYQKNC
mmetsp:Transcript_1729/g.2605  ORF Transcript_1729/g.2605 Transcript_1729/m.2605 type:complete len:116 (-) Transcript_1729:24-371(-)|eukprot:CAMPEP_0203754330 /NCGR_PEP_ID=MMETSP0098-20131031/7939_1 /ASSEMBLY_ACC=CAM_ASM_000208 /TAXON_ID=96639 /ORGANISM=" , Strain NY0313808BC1" /LENGTH=115 /DNA_ID=CAMNT_0050645277 /DNA_START=195 /DNA_END=542 /DNA_ORIENTATION=+